MDFIEKLGDTITEKGKEAADKARELAEIARLKSRISICEEVIKKNYLEIGKQYYEKYGNTSENREDSVPENTDDRMPGIPVNLFEKQCRAIYNADCGIKDLQKKIREIKGL